MQRKNSGIVVLSSFIGILFYSFMKSVIDLLEGILEMPITFKEPPREIEWLLAKR